MLPRTPSSASSIPFQPQHDGRIVVRPLADPSRSIDVTESVIRCIASSIEDAVGGNPVLNRLEAERAVRAMTHSARHGLAEASR